MIAPYDWQLLQVFQSTLPRGERHKRPLFFVCEANFNPRSHEGSDQTLSSVRCSPQISIHAPTRGATDNIIDEQRDELFQSTLPRGERHGSSQFSGMPVVISIHAPTRGATHGSANQYKSNLIFQSTLPRGERRLATKAMKCNNKISIHAPTRGATAVENPVGIISGISIHAPTRGATDLSRNSSPITGISIHAPTRGAKILL